MTKSWGLGGNAPWTPVIYNSNNNNLMSYIYNTPIKGMTIYTTGADSNSL
jgi:hypothetical protein